MLPSSILFVLSTIFSKALSGVLCGIALLRTIVKVPLNRSLTSQMRCGRGNTALYRNVGGRDGPLISGDEPYSTSSSPLPYPGNGVLSLRDVYLAMPEGVKLGQPVTLSCSFQLEGDILYTVKWYKFQDEFYRYTPKENPPTKFFSVAGLTETAIDKSRSNGTQLTLRHMTEEMSGLYSCEVSADAPSFQTATVSRNIMVVDPPKSKPVMAGLKSKYKLDEAIHVNCTAPGSKPAANITWSINGITPARKHIDDRRRMVEGDLEQTISSLRIHAREANFPGGRLRLGCTATIFQEYQQSSEKILMLEATERLTKTRKNSDMNGPPNWDDGQVGWSPSYPNMHRHTPLPPTEGLITGEEQDMLEKSSNGSAAATTSLLLQLAVIALAYLTTSNQQ